MADDLDLPLDPPFTVLDYVAARVAGGETLAELARRAGASLGWDVSRPSLHYALKREYGAELLTRIDAARAEGADALADRSLEVAQEPVLDSASAARQRNEIGALQWLAEGYNRQRYGSAKAAVNVNVAVGALHLDALRARARTVPERHTLPVSERHTDLSLPGPGATEDATVVEIADANPL